MDKIIYCKYQLNKPHNRKTEYALFRTKQAYWEILGEKPGRLLAYHLKQQNNMNQIVGTQQPDGTISTSSEVINDTFKSCYTPLYASQGELNKHKFKNFFMDLNLPQLSNSDREFLKAPLRSNKKHVS